ncbi:FAD-binding domain-containing protein [Xylaria grammica]|nr:FAD-binding domain-containing protein [Xylaria grammica]
MEINFRLTHNELRMKGAIRIPLVAMTLIFPSLISSSCTNLSSSFPGKVLFPSDSGYTDSVSSYFFLNQQENPTCIIAPSTTNEVAEIVRSIASHGYRSEKVAIRSGGHSPNRGFSNINHGVTIDLRGLNQIEMRETSSDIVSLGTGALWIDVSDFLDPLNRTAVGSRVASVGIGGFITGGGISFFSPRYGFSCDNVENMQVVLANGTIINANATSNPRLFRALKGGQNNFGIVTRFDIKTYSQPAFWGGAIQYPESADAAQLDAFRRFKQGPYDPFSEIEQTFVYFGTQNSFSSTNNLFYSKSGVNESNLRPFIDIQPQISNTVRVSQPSDFALELEKFQPTDSYSTWATFSFPISADILSQVHSEWKSATSSLASSHPNITGVLTFQSIPPPPAADRPPNSMPFRSSSTPHENIVLTLLTFYWSEEEESQSIESGVRKLAQSIQMLAGNTTQFKYLNYAGGWQDPIGGYGKAGKEELRQVAKMYDPSGFFQKSVKGGFKLYK